METKKNNTIDPNLEKKLVPRRNGDDHEIKPKNSPSGNKLTESKDSSKSDKP